MYTRVSKMRGEVEDKMQKLGFFSLGKWSENEAKVLTIREETKKYVLKHSFETQFG